ncbi:MAG TPA: PrsW family glutamic-type intramembrane protease [Candidatus Bathyarchaeia archaeon]
MTEESYPPPPPPPPAEVSKSHLHGPETRFFLGIRRRLSVLEQPIPLKGGKKPKVGMLVAFIISATAGLGIAFLLQTALTPLGDVALIVLIAPLTEEPVKAIGMFIVVFLLWKAIPNRRYGAALGAASGLGFGIAESILYIYGFIVRNSPVEDIAVRILVTPFMHPLWSAFVGIGVFALIAKKSNPKGSSLTLPLIFLFLGMLNHIIWNSIATALSSAGYFPMLLVNLILVFPLFAIILRDFLGGHFNFQNFFKSIPELPEPYPTVMLPPPPP